MQHRLLTSAEQFIDVASDSTVWLQFEAKVLDAFRVAMETDYTQPDSNMVQIPSFWHILPVWDFCCFSTIEKKDQNVLRGANSAGSSNFNLRRFATQSKPIRRWKDCGSRFFAGFCYCQGVDKLAIKLRGSFEKICKKKKKERKKKIQTAVSLLISLTQKATCPLFCFYSLYDIRHSI